MMFEQVNVDRNVLEAGSFCVGMPRLRTASPAEVDGSLLSEGPVPSVHDRTYPAMAQAAPARRVSHHFVWKELTQCTSS